MQKKGAALRLARAEDGAVAGAAPASSGRTEAEAAPPLPGPAQVSP